MSFIQDFAELCPQTVVWQAMTSRDAYGKPSYGDVQTFSGRRVNMKSRIPTKAGIGPKGEGADVIAEASIWILGLPTFGPGSGYEDRCYLLGETVYPPILSIQTFPDETEEIYCKVMLGSANG